MTVKPFSRQNFTYRNYNVINATPVATYSLSSLAASYNEGDTITITITTGFLLDGTVLYWTTSGTSTAADFSDNLTSGSVTITNNTATVTRTLLSDLSTEGTETFVFELRTVSTSGTIVATTSSANVLDTSTSPKDYSVLFNGSSQYLTTPANAAFQLTGDFTVEAWIYPTAINSYNMIFGSENGQTSDYLTIKSTVLELSIGGNAFPAWTQNFVVNTWYHVAVTRSSNTLRAFVNGVQLTLSAGSATNSSQLFQSSVGVSIGRYGNTNTPYYFTGHISNARIVKGTAVYTAAFTPPTAQLTAITNTSLLTCKGGTIADASTNAFTITNTGTALVSGENPFGNYSMSFNGSSYLSVPNNAALNLASNDYTIEGWWYFTDLSNQAMISKYSAPGGGWAVQWYSTNNLRMVFNSAGGDSVYSFAWTPTINTWYHVAITRSGTNGRAFINGTQIGSTTTFVTAHGDSSGTLQVGLTHTVSEYTRGYASNVRIVKGTALYTANFTPPTSPLSAIANTTFLTCQYAELFDASTNYFTITNNGPAPAITANPFDNYAYSFNGSSQYLTVPSNAALGFGTGDFTVEFWVYPTVNARQDWFDLNDTVSRLLIYYNGTTINYYTGAGAGVADRITGAAMTLNSWQHIAVSRVSGNTKLFINGTQSGSTYADSRSHETLPLTIGKDSAGSTYVTGYMSNIRVIKGTGLYSANSTITTAPLTAVANTSLLTAQYAELFDASTNYLVVTNTGAARAVATNLFAAPNNLKNYSGKFNGSNQWVEVPGTHTIFAATSENFTIEAWVYLRSLPSNSMVCGWNKSGFDYFSISPSNASLNMNNTYNSVMNFSFATNTWYHVAFSRTSNIVKGFVNGNLLFTGSSDSAQFGDGTVLFGIGRWYTTPNYYFPGYISNFRFLKGTGLYTSAFTPSATPLLPAANTTLLTLQTNRIYDSGPKQFTISSNGSTTMSYLSPFPTS